MKKITLCFLLLISNLGFTQTQKIAQLLNQQLQKEYNRFYDDRDREKFAVTEPFRIDENNVLHFAFTNSDITNGKKISISQQVPLDKIVAFDKDYDVYFQTSDNDVTEIRTDYEANGNIIRTNTDKTHLFFTEINREPHPKKLMKKLKKAFEKAGYDVECSFLNP